MKKTPGTWIGLLLVGCGLVGCGGEGGVAAPPAGPSGAVAPSTPTAQSTAPAASATAAAPASPELAGDPALVALAKAAAACPFDEKEEEFDEACPAYKAWWDGGMGDLGERHALLLSMLESPDTKIQALAARPGFQNTGTFFDDPIRARRLFAVARTAKIGWVPWDVGHQIARVDAEKLGLSAELRALAKSPSASLRVGLAASASFHPTALVLELTRDFLKDESQNVRKSAIAALGLDTPPVEGVCKLLTELLPRTDAESSDILWSGATSRCPGMGELVIAEVAKRVADPSKVGEPLGPFYSMTASGVCERTKSEDLKKKAVRLIVSLTSPKVPSSATRVMAINVLGGCDKSAAEKALGALARDKDAAVAEQAKKSLAELKQK